MFEQYQSQHAIVHMVQESRLTNIPISAEKIQKETEKDDILLKVIEKMKNGWPRLRKNVLKELLSYFDQ